MLFHLLSKTMKHNCWLALSRHHILTEYMNIISFTTSWIQSHNACGLEEFLINHFLQHLLSFIKELLGFFSYSKRSQKRKLKCSDSQTRFILHFQHITASIWQQGLKTLPIFTLLCKTFRLLWFSLHFIQHYIFVDCWVTLKTLCVVSYFHSKLLSHLI